VEHHEKLRKMKNEYIMALKNSFDQTKFA